MDEDGNSWLRRAKFSHNISHENGSFSGLKSRQRSASFGQYDFSLNQRKLVSDKTDVQIHPVTNKVRSVSPLPRSVFPETFKQARSEKKRFSTPNRKIYQEKGISGLFSFMDCHEKKSSKPDKTDQQVSCIVVREKAKHRSVSPLPESIISEAKESCKDKRLMRKLCVRDDEQKSPRLSLCSGKSNAKSKNKKDSNSPKFSDYIGEKICDMSLDLKKLYLGLRFAHGAHSKLYQGVYENEDVAVKIIQVPDDDENGVLAVKLERQFISEVAFLSQLKHPNVLKFVAALKQAPTFCILTEFLSGGSLRLYLHKLEHKPVPMQELVSLALDIARGMAYVHSQGIMHRDLKPENVLFDGKFHLKIADFGTACEEAYCNVLDDEPGTYRWMAPEMIKRKCYGRKVDVYSFGLILWEMVAGRIPYDYMNPIQAAFAVANKNLRPTMPSSCPPAMRALIEQCWSVHPDRRPEFWQIVKVLEMFKTCLNVDGTLNLAHHPILEENKKGLLRWIQKFGPVYPVSRPQLR